MGHVYSDVIQYRGTHYDFGYRQGQLLKDSLIIPNRQKQWSSRRERHFTVNVSEVKQAILQVAPKIWDELHGLADALQWSTEDTVREFGGYYLEYGRSGCSIFTGADYMIRNYDNHPLSYEGRYVLYQPTDQGYALVGPSMQITGRTDGINEKGLAMGYNFVNRRNTDDGFVCNMIGRLILETCANVEEAVALLKEIPHRHTFSYVLLDKNEETYVVEASPRAVEIRKSNFCTNHFEKLTEENRYRLDDSIRRQQAIQDQQHHATDPYHAFRMLNDAAKHVFSKKYAASAGTLHTTAYFPKDLKTWIALGGDRMPLIFDFKQWLQGDNTHAKRIKGELETDLPFVQMTLI
ncbi:predicted choloylglycine hydrolase [Bacillus oleivorans]|uniref:Predicted choloylglycine hydrolase n=1 Tax=Bacillus oleivorans TaxID=1448271 RepID=A0A285D5L8_9BACI|nr:C45 family peptidase [Bacillus oleivorans]SNX74463.1 predicted choloylglycine hydrolase [Bacillus oleivorans]